MNSVAERALQTINQQFSKVNSDMSRIMVAAIFLFFSASSYAEQKTQVYVFDQCQNDSVGTRVAYHVRELLRQSSSASVVADIDESEAVVHMMCHNPDEDERGKRSRYAYAIMYASSRGTYDYLLSLSLGTCGSLRTKECAETIAATLDREILKAKSKISSGQFRPAAL